MVSILPHDHDPIKRDTSCQLSNCTHLCFSCVAQWQLALRQLCDHHSPSEIQVKQPFVVYRLVRVCCNIAHLFVGVTPWYQDESTNWLPETHSHILQTDINDPL
jgi:hypothetical protein